MEELQKEFMSICKEHGFSKTAYSFVHESGDKLSPYCCKIGGAVPHLPGEGVPICQSCGAQHELMAQFYVPMLPDRVQKLFLPEHRKSMVAFTICNECIEGFKARIYREDELDTVEYTPARENRFLDPFIITGFKEYTSYPFPTQLFENDHFESLRGALFRKINEDSVYDIISWYNGINLLGYPDFVQGDESVEGSEIFMNIVEDQCYTHMLGDAGTGQIYKNSNDEFEFTWACC